MDGRRRGWGRHADVLGHVEHVYFPRSAQALGGLHTAPLSSAREGVALAKEEGMDTVIIDTAGRLQIDATLMQELQEVRVVPHMVGCNACHPSRPSLGDAV